MNILGYSIAAQLQRQSTDAVTELVLRCCVYWPNRLGWRQKVLQPPSMFMLLSWWCPLGHDKRHLPAIQNFHCGSIDTNFDPPQFPLDSTFKAALYTVTVFNGITEASHPPCTCLTLWMRSWRMIVYIYYITAAGNSCSTQLGTSCQSNRYGTENEDGTARPSRTKSHLLGHSPPAIQAGRRVGPAL